jgi:hypothetical protein
MLSLCCTKVVRERLHLAGTLPPPVNPSSRLGNWYVHLARFGHQQIVLATSERSLLTVLLPSRNLRDNIEASFHAELAKLLAKLQIPGLVSPIGVKEPGRIGVIEPLFGGQKRTSRRVKNVQIFDRWQV